MVGQVGLHAILSPWLFAALTALLAGAHSAIWGMYKDAPHEGFSARTFVRSMIFAVGLGLLLYAVTELYPAGPGSLVIFFGVVYVVERAVAETYKTFFRQQDQSKYIIPMQFAVFGKPVQSRAARALLGVVYLGLMVGMVWLIHLAQRALGTPVPLWAIFTIGAAGGWFSAFGGAWKDAPIEGFQILKFFRSPLLAGTYALLVSRLTTDLVLITLAAEGFVIMTTETYKTFFFPSKPRGKFADKPVLFPRWLRLRQRFVPLYVLIWVVVIGAYTLAVTGGETARDDQLSAPSGFSPANPL